MKRIPKKPLVSILLCLILIFVPVFSTFAEEDTDDLVITETVEEEKVETSVEETDEETDDSTDDNSDDDAEDDSDDEDEDYDEVSEEVNVTNTTEINEVIEIAEEATDTPEEPLPVNVLILPKFEIGSMSGDFAGEAQLFYEAYCPDSDIYKVANAAEGSKLYYQDGVAIFMTGMGKVNAAQNLMALLTDPGFDFSEAYILSVGCAGGATETTVLGDVFLITGIADYDLGHHADPREMEDPESPTWFHDEDFDTTAYRLLNQDLIGKVWPMIQDIPCSSSEEIKEVMAKAFDNAEWASRDPGVHKGTSMTGDNYWKGSFDEENARAITNYYPLPDPYATTEMEEIAVAITADRMGMLNRLITLRGVVDIDVFTDEITPEMLWASDQDSLPENTIDTVNSFEPTMENLFNVGSVIVDAILNGEL